MPPPLPAPRPRRRRSPPRLCSSPPPVDEEDLEPLALPAPRLAACAAPQFSLEPIAPAPRPASPSALLAVPALLPTNGTHDGAAPPPGEDEGSEGEGSEGEGDGSEGEEDEVSSPPH